MQYIALTESGSMILETVLSETSQAQVYLRHVSSFESLLRQMNKRSPLRATLAALQKRIWGPAVFVGFQGEQTLGVPTLNGGLCLLHTSHGPLPDFLEQIETTLNLRFAS